MNDAEGSSHNRVDEEAKTTLPEGVGLSLNGFATEKEARQLGENILSVMRLAGKSMDLSGIDGVTVSFDYNRSLLEIDRGIEGLRPLTATNGEDGAFGAGMSPAVVRNSQIKTHLVFNAPAVWGLIDVEHETFQLAAHLVYHECAHAAVHSAFDAVFPNIILREKYDNWCATYRGEVIDACWQEYCVTRISASWGEDPTSGYVQILLAALAETDDTANDAIRSYRLHGDLDRVLGQVLPLYARLVKWAAYVVGTLHGLNNTVEDIDDLKSTLTEHWFYEYFIRVGNAGEDIWGQFGVWKDRSSFETIGDIAIDVLSEGGIDLYEERVDIPFRMNNTPSF